MRVRFPLAAPIPLLFLMNVRTFLSLLETPIPSGSPALTPEERAYIVDRWQAYDLAMGDPWRNDFEDDSEAADALRYEHYVIDGVKNKFPHISVEQIEEVTDSLR